MITDELQKTLADHKLWLKTDHREGKRAVRRYTFLRNADLGSTDLSNADLAGANLAAANLANTVLRNTDLWDADLSGADLRGANLTGSNLRYANLTNANLTSAIFTLEIKNVGWFRGTTFSEEAIPWLILNPRYSEFADTLTFV